MADFQPQFEQWRHGGWYVTNIRRASGAVGCVAKIADGKWAIACGEEFGDLTFSTRSDAAKAELIFQPAGGAGRPPRDRAYARDRRMARRERPQGAGTGPGRD
jgi:hypothetical protein